MTKKFKMYDLMRIVVYNRVNTAVIIVVHKSEKSAKIEKSGL